MVGTIGVIGVQGDVEEHILSLRGAMAGFGMEGKVVWARRRSDLEGADGIIIPGGESTTISKLLDRFDLRDTVLDLAREGRPVLGTCAGCVLMAKEGDSQVERTRTTLLGLMDMSVDRNAFGSQRESFEAPLSIEGVGTYPGVFIRAPLITRVWGDCIALSKMGGGIVLARQGRMVAAVFHPELTGDPRFYRLFLDLFEEG